MSRYLARLQRLLAKERAPAELTELTDGAFVGFVSDQGSPFCEDESAIEERAALAADRVPACYLDAWARLQCQRPLSVAGAALLRTGRDSWSGEDWRAFFDERAGIAEFDGGLPRLEAEARAFTCCVAEWLNRNPVRSSSDRCLRCGEAEQGPRPAAALRNRDYRPRLAAFALLVGLVRRQTGRGRRRLRGNGDRDTGAVSK